uniref:Protein VAC14 homolog n=1 Tax=Lygus hesperus TaxID=30085 RepID=A0A0A9X6L4_LYGHE
MADRDHAPLSIACVRALTDKQYDKRKAAASEIEKMVKEFAAMNNTVQIRKLLRVLGTEFTMSQNPNFKKGGLMGLAAVAIALGKDSAEYAEHLIRPILTNFSDNETKIRYFACEALYNVVKVTRGAVLPYFSEIFSGLSRLAADHDQGVKNASEHLDKLLKDIVTENATFDLVGFMPLLRERLYSKNTFARQYIISWVTVLDAVPDIQLILFLPELLDGLFDLLNDPNSRNLCGHVLSEFLRSINKDPSKVQFTQMINILINHSQSPDETLQMTALSWIKDFIHLSNKQMLPYASGILSAILPCFAYESEAKRGIKDVAKAVNANLMELINPKLDDEGQSDETHQRKSECDLDLSSVLDVLKKQLANTSMNTKVASLTWLYHLHNSIPKRMLMQVDDLFPTLLHVLTDHSDEVVQHGLNVLAQIISPESEAGRVPVPDSPQHPFFENFLHSLIGLFREDRQLLEERGSFIIRQLCILLSAEDVYKSAAEIMRSEHDLKFARVMVDTLNTILLTSSELFQLRNVLKNEENEKLFQCLYETWCHNPVATISLCLLTQNYEHTCDLIMILANYEISVEFLAEVDRLIQLIESPIFIYLRLELLQVPHNYYLIRSMYGLLMLLPQSETFHLLRHRLECIPKLHFFHESRNRVDGKESGNKYNLEFDSLRGHFTTTQDKHKL